MRIEPFTSFLLEKFLFTDTRVEWCVDVEKKFSIHHRSVGAWQKFALFLLARNKFLCRSSNHHLTLSFIICAKKTAVVVSFLPVLWFFYCSHLRRGYMYVSSTHSLHGGQFFSTSKLFYPLQDSFGAPTQQPTQKISSFTYHHTFAFIASTHLNLEFGSSKNARLHTGTLRSPRSLND